MTISGVYKITNTLNDDCYIGSSFEVHRRLVDHKRFLLNGTHPNKHLQAAFNKYGQENFVFEQIFECEAIESIIIESENKYIKLYAQNGKEYPAYNNRPDAATNKGWKMTPEQRKNMSEARKGIRLNISNERREQLKELGAAMNANEEYKMKRVETRKARGWFKNPEEFKLKSSDSHMGKKHAPETHAKISAFLKGDGAKQKYKPVERINPNTGEVKEYESIKAAAQEGFHAGHISDVLRGLTDTHKGYCWQFINAKDRKVNSKPVIRKVRIYKSKAVQRIDCDTGEVVEYNSLRDAARWGFDRKLVSSACRGRTAKYKNYFWRYLSK